MFTTENPEAPLRHTDLVGPDPRSESEKDSQDPRFPLRPRTRVHRSGVPISRLVGLGKSSHTQGPEIGFQSPLTDPFKPDSLYCPGTTGTVGQGSGTERRRPRTTARKQKKTSPHVPIHASPPRVPARPRPRSEDRVNEGRKRSPLRGTCRPCHGWSRSA